MSHFYLTLPSNSSHKFFPDNTLTHFKTHLHNAISLPGKNWEAGLSEIMFSKNWYNYDRDEENTPTLTITCVHCPNLDGILQSVPDKVELRNAYSTDIRIPSGHYDSMETVTAKINALIQDTYRRPFDVRGSRKQVPLNTAPELKYSPVSRKVAVTVHPNQTLTWSREIAQILGLGPKQMKMINPSNENAVVIKAQRTSDIGNGVNSLYVYTDIISPVPVGETVAPLLRIVDTRGEHGETIHRYYDRPRYVPVQKLHFDTIEIDIRTDQGEPVPFEHGKLVCVVHFRESKEAYFQQ
jgi:hypothetical protein